MEDNKNDMVEKRGIEEERDIEDKKKKEDEKKEEDEKRIVDNLKTGIGVVMALFLLGLPLFNMNQSENMPRISFSFNQPQGSNPKNGLQVTVNQISGGKTSELYSFKESRMSYPSDELVESYHRMGYYEEAVSYAESVQRDIENGKIESVVRGAWINGLLADSYLELGDYEEGKRFIDNAINVYREMGEEKENYYYVYYLQGKYYLKTEQYEDAAAYMEQALEYVDHSRKKTTWDEMREAYIYCDAGIAYRKLENPDRAESCIKKAYEIVSEKMLESEIANVYYKDVLEPEIRELFHASCNEAEGGEANEEISGAAGGEKEYEQWFSERFGEET